MSKEEFHAFPQERQDAIDMRVQARQPYNPPNSPSNPANKRKAAANIQDMAIASTVHSPQQTTAIMPKPGHILIDQAKMEQQISTQDPGFTNPSSDPVAVSLDLPSRFAYYGFKDLYVKPFVGFHLGKLSRAHVEKSFLPMVEAVSSVLSTTTGEQHLGFKLTLPDFYFVLYWLKQNSFTKSVFMHTTSCINEAHIKDVMDGKKLKESLTISEIIHKTSLKVVTLEQMPNPEVFKLDYPGVYLRPATMQDTLEITMSPNVGDAEWLYLAELASYLTFDVKNKDGSDLNMEQRIELMNDFSGDDIFMTKKYGDSVADYGVVEKIHVRCKECGASRDSKISLDAHSFLSAA